MDDDVNQNAENEVQDNNVGNNNQNIFNDPIVGRNVRPQRLRRRPLHFENYEGVGYICHRENPRVLRPARRAGRGRPRQNENRDSEVILNENNQNNKGNIQEIGNIVHRVADGVVLVDENNQNNAENIQNVIQEIREEEIGNIVHGVADGVVLVDENNHNNGENIQNVIREVREEEIAVNEMEPELVVVDNPIRNNQGDNDVDEIYSDAASVCSETPDDSFVNDE